MGIDFTGGSLFMVLLLFAAGLLCIIKGGDLFVDAASWIAEASGIPKFIIGATVVSFATTMPEMLVSVFAALQGNADIAVGNAVGSVTANVGLIMCVALICMECAMTRKQFGVKACLLLAAILALFGFTRDGQLSVLESVLILVIFVGFLVESLIAARQEQGSELPAQEERPKIDKKTVLLNIGKFLLGAAGIVLGAQLLIDNCAGAHAGRAGRGHRRHHDRHWHLAARACNHPDRHQEKAGFAVGGQHHRRKHHGSDADHAPVRGHSGQAHDGGAPGHAAGHPRLPDHLRRGADSRAGSGQVQALDRLPDRRAVHRLSDYHVHLLRRINHPSKAPFAVFHGREGGF